MYGTSQSLNLADFKLPSREGKPLSSPTARIICSCQQQMALLQQQEKKLRSFKILCLGEKKKKKTNLSYILPLIKCCALWTQSRCSEHWV